MAPSDRRKNEKRDSGTGLSRLYDSLGRRLGKRLFDELRQSDSLRPRLNPSKVAAAVLSNARLMSSRGTFRLDATHPPTSYRIEFLRGRSPNAALTLTHGESAALDRELEVFEATLQKEITEAYRASLYR